jgi:hypothetical protein
MAITQLPKVYQSDLESRTYFKNWGSNLQKEGSDLRKSPLHTSLKRQDDKTQEYDGYSAHSYGEINPYKVCEIAITTFNSGNPLSPSADQWGNWRSRGIGVYDQVLLWPQEKVWEMAFSNSFESAYSKLDQQGLLSKVSQISEAFRSVAMIAGQSAGGGGDSTTGQTAAGGRFMSKYKEAPAWSGTKPLQLSSNLSFQFRFGQSGAFSGEQEVVRPIMALALPFAPRAASKEASNYLIGPAPTAPTFFWTFIQRAPELMGKIKDDLTTDSANTSGLGEVVNRITNAENSIIEHMNTTIERVLNGDETIGQGGTFLNVRIGKMVFPPLVVHDVSWKFDMTHTDEYGYPTFGTISFGGLEAIEIASQSMIKSLFPGVL